MKKKLFSVFSTLSSFTLVFSGCAWLPGNTQPQERPDAPKASATPTPTSRATVSPSPITSPTESAVDTVPDATASPETSPTAAASDEVSQNRYQDGTYALVGNYMSPAGPHTLDVTITIENDIVTDVVIVPESNSGGTNKSQVNFAAGINELVVGKELDTIETFASVNGSSLTPIGFQVAVEQLKAESSLTQ